MQFLKYTLLSLLVISFISCTTDDPDNNSNGSNNDDTTSQVQEVSLGDTASIEIYPQGDEDTLAISIEDTGIYIFSFDNIPVELGEDVVVYIEDSNGKAPHNMIGDYRIDINREIVFVGQLIPGIYYLRIKDVWHNEESTTSFPFTFTKDTSDLHEINGTRSTATPLKLNDTLYFSIFPVNDEDFFSFTVVDSGSYDIRIDDIPYVFHDKNEFTLRDEADEIIFLIHNHETNTFVNTLDLNTGTYILDIEEGPWGDRSSQEQWQLSITPNSDGVQ